MTTAHRKRCDLRNSPSGVRIVSRASAIPGRSVLPCAASLSWPGRAGTSWKPRTLACATASIATSQTRASVGRTAMRCCPPTCSAGAAARWTLRSLPRVPPNIWTRACHWPRNLSRPHPLNAREPLASACWSGGRRAPGAGWRHRRMTASACWIGSLETTISPVTAPSISRMRKIAPATEAAHTSKTMTIMPLRGAL